MSSQSGGLGRMHDFLQAEALLAEYRLFLKRYTGLATIESLTKNLMAIESFCFDLENKPEVMKAITRLYTSSQTDFQRALFCSWFSLSMARYLGLGQSQQRNLFYGGLLQDIGKYVVDDSVSRFIANLGCNKIPVFGQHDLEDAHPLLSSSFIEHQFPDEESLRELVLHHHSRADGTGYPNYVVESQLGLDDQLLIIANEICDRLERLGSYSKLPGVRAVLRVASLLYFSDTQTKVCQMLKHCFDESESTGTKAGQSVCKVSNRNIEHKVKLLDEFMAALLNISGDLIPYDFDIVVRGIRSNISRLVNLANETGLLVAGVFDIRHELSAQERQEVSDLFSALPEVLLKFRFYLDFLRRSKQYELESTDLNKALVAVKACLRCYEENGAYAA